MRKMLAVLAGMLVAMAVTGPALATGPNAPKDCEAYFYFGTRQNLCDDFPGHKDVTCTQVGHRVQLKSNNVDPWDLDGLAGGDRGQIGIGCEAKPRRIVTHSASPSPSRSRSVQGDALPLTGPSGWALGAVGGLVLLAGIGAMVVSKRRRTRFTA